MVAVLPGGDVMPAYLLQCVGIFSLPTLYSFFFDGVFSCAPILRGRTTFAFSLCLHLMFNVTWVERLLKTVRGDRQSMP